jgi:hypothetical protein
VITEGYGYMTTNGIRKGYDEYKGLSEIEGYPIL